MPLTLYTIGYGHWKDTKRRMRGMLSALKNAHITTLLDIRISPCASDPGDKGNYTARDWNLQVSGGISHAMKEAGISYRWMVELGNPQKRDPDMAVLRSQIASGDSAWPVIRGLQSLQEMLRDEEQRYCLLCACGTFDECHRSIIADSLSERFFFGHLSIVDLPPGE
jgi:Protein of unknown function, DUF488